jgi:hypothetical protein
MIRFANPSTDLRRLFLLRGIAIAGQAVAVALAVGWFETTLPVGAMAAVILALCAVNARTWWRLQRPQSVGERELFLAPPPRAPPSTCPSSWRAIPTRTRTSPR